MELERETHMANDTGTRRKPGLWRGRGPWPRQHARGHAAEATTSVPVVARSDLGTEPAGSVATVAPTPSDPAPTEPGYWPPSRMAGVLCILTYVAQDGHEEILDQFRAVQDVFRAGLVENPPRGKWHLTVRGTEVLKEWGLDRALDVPERQMAGVPAGAAAH
jgi:hypothetical protein